MILQRDGVLVLLQEVHREYGNRIDMVNGRTSWRWISTSTSIDALVGKAKATANAYEDVQVSDLTIASLSNGTLEALEIEALGSSEETRFCQHCARHLPTKYFGFEESTDRQLLTCVRCQAKNDGKMPRGTLRVIQ